MDGLRLVEELRDLRPAMQIIVISGYHLEDNATREPRIDGFLARPFQIETIAKVALGAGVGNFTRDRGRDGPHLFNAFSVRHPTQYRAPLK
jgi:ActR/RegA family two-component response regulator